jgi:glycosyltransferase involved in cell wall biosynthesis
MSFECVVAGSHLRFEGVFQRPQQLLTRIARRVPVLFIEEPFLGAADRDEFEQHGELTVLRPVRRALGTERIDARTLQAARAWVGGRRALVWLYTPMMLALAGAFGDAPLVYDCMDELAAFAFAPPDMREREGALLTRADFVFAGGRSLYERRRSLGEKVKLFASGVEFEHFARAQTLTPHPLFAHLAAPVFGYFGAIDERIDLDVLLALAEGGGNLVLIGPIVKIAPAVLPRRPNVHFTGQLDYALLPAFLAGFDVAIMPFARNDATANISPTKTPEYLAGGKPVVSTPISDVVADYGDLVTYADTPQAFAQACRVALPPDPRRIALGIERARSAGWDTIVAEMWSDLAEVSVPSPK